MRPTVQELYKEIERLRAQLENDWTSKVRCSCGKVIHVTTRNVREVIQSPIRVTYGDDSIGKAMLRGALRQ